MTISQTGTVMVKNKDKQSFSPWANTVYSYLHNQHSSPVVASIRSGEGVSRVVHFTFISTATTSTTTVKTSWDEVFR